MITTNARTYRQVMAHVVDKSAEAFAGTPRAHAFFIFHDGLSAWWEAEAQDYLKSRGFEHRQIRSNTTANVGALRG